MTEHLDKVRTRVTLSEYEILNVHTTDYPGTYPGRDDSWDIDEFKQNFHVDVKSLTEREMEFDMVGLDCSLANAFRRIIIAEVPTMAVDKVCIHNNTSIIQDEVLAHRLGLIPFKADPRLFEYKKPDAEESEFDSLCFELKVRCKKNPKALKDSTDPDDLYIDNKVLTKHLRWVPFGNQVDMFTEPEIGPVEPDILIAKLRPGQEIDIKMYLFKSTGSDHAKFSPVATAHYRLLPEIILKEKITGDRAHALQKCFPKGVIEIIKKKGVDVAVVGNPRLDTCSREVLRYDDLKDAVELNKVRNHFIFNVESTGALPPDILVTEAIKILMERCKNFTQELDIVEQLDDME